MELTDRAAFLKKIHLFADLDDEQIEKVAEKFAEISFDSGDVILEQGALADSFYVIYRGKVRVYRHVDGEDENLARLISSDYFGEMEVLEERGARTASIAALVPTTVLRITGEDLTEIIRAYPSIKPNIEISIASRKLVRKVHFKWLRPNEEIYFLARKHNLFLLQALAVPVFTLLVPAFILLWGGLVVSKAAMGFGGAILVANLGWIAWRYIDWGNDFYVVTSERVVWIEKVLWLYDSRTEAPLAEVLSVGVDSDLIGRAFNYGNVYVRTFVGAIPFKQVLYPHQAKNMIEEYWRRTQKASEQAEKEAFKDALREKLGLVSPSSNEKKTDHTRPPKPNFIKLFIINLFKQRLEEGDVVTYRKHLFVLFKQTLFPTFVFFSLLYFLIRQLFVSGLDTISTSLAILLIPAFFWWLYQYVDWTNDIFRVTNDQILDIDKKPLGNETRRAAPLDNIIGTRYERVGVLGYILNFGTVYIDIGSEQFSFNDVLDPATVQSDIDRRRLNRVSGKKAAERAEERNRLVDWMSSYYQDIQEIQAELDARDARKKSE